MKTFNIISKSSRWFSLKEDIESIRDEYSWAVRSNYMSVNIALETYLKRKKK